MGKVNFSVFADLHYREGNWNWADKRLSAVFERAEKSGSQFIMHCGDFCHNVRTAKEIIEQYNNFHIPSYHTMGNHDFEESQDISEVCEAYRMNGRSFYSFEIDGNKFISLDTNFYHNESGELCHYANASVYEKCHQKEQSLSPEQLDFLARELDSCSGMAVIFSHASVWRSNGITNKTDAQKIIFAHSNVPVLWINGHYHRNSLNILNNLAVFDLNSTTSDWVNNPHNAYPPELMAKFRLSNHELLFSEPVHAVVTVDGDGEVKIEGMDGAMYLGITHEMTGNPSADKMGIECDASVLSAHFRIITEK
ncbi:MAG: metallophosphoesterase [Lentisphaeria bacterium]|nr:metallophosphoesterase [Lentisphaeria bacterium]